MSAEKLHALRDSKIEEPSSSRPSSERLPSADLRHISAYAALDGEERDVNIEREVARIEKERAELRARLGIEKPAASVSTAAEATPWVAEEEVKKILKLPRTERAAALAEYKKSLMEQREAMAAYRDEAEKILMANPDTPKDQLLQMLAKHEATHTFSPVQKQTVNKIIDIYAERRQKAKDIRSQFPNNTELVNHLMRESGGKEFPADSKFDVEVGPMNLIVYATPEQIAATKFHEKQVGGFASGDKDKINYVFVDKTSKEKEDIKNHEQQHIINNLFEEGLDSMWSTSWEKAHQLEAEYTAETDPNEKDKKLKELSDTLLQYGYGVAKDEMFAWLQEPHRQLSELRKLLKPNSTYEYDYFKKFRQKYKNNPKLKKMSDEVLVAEYGKKIDQAVTILEDLQRILSPKDIIALLSDIPLERWSTAAARIYQEKLKDPEIKAGKTPETEPGKSVEDIKNNEKFKTNENDSTKSKKGEKHEGNEGHDTHGGKHEKAHKHEHGHGKERGAMFKIQSAGILAGSVIAAGAVEGILAPMAINALGLGPAVQAGLSGIGLGAAWLGPASMLGLSFVFNLIGNLASGWAKDNPISELLGRFGVKGGGGGGGGGGAKPKPAGGGGDHH